MQFKYMLFVGVYDNRLNRSMYGQPMSKDIEEFVHNRPEVYAVLRVRRVL